MKSSLIILLFSIIIIANSANICIPNNNDCGFLEVCKNQICVHKKFLDNTHGIEILGLFLIMITSLLSAVGGIGGGLFFVPIALAAFNFNFDTAVPLSSATTAFVLIFRYIWACFKEKHPKYPKVNRPIINYEISAIFSPSLLLGTTIGIILNSVLPTWLILVAIVGFLSLSFYKTSQKAKDIYKQEKQQNQNNTKKINQISNLNEENQNIQTKSINTEIQINQSLLNQGQQQLQYGNQETQVQQEEQSCQKQQQEITEEANQQRNQDSQLEQQNQLMVQKFLKQDSRMISYEKVSYIIIAMIIILILSLFKGSKKRNSIVDIELCSAGYWVLSFIFIPIALLMLWMILKQTIKSYDEKSKCGYPFLYNDFRWDQKTAQKTIIIGLTVGILASMLGIGGGILLGPLLLQLKLEASVASYSSSFMALFTSISAAMQFIIFGQLEWDYAGFFCLFALVGYMVGIIYVMGWIKKHEKQSLIVFSILIILILAVALFLWTGIRKINDEKDQGKDYVGFKSPC